MKTGRGVGPTDAAGGPARHLPVMLAEVLAHLAPKDAGTCLDGTFGAGGYTRAILEAANGRVIAIDRDPTAIAGGQALVEETGGRLTLVHERFSHLDQVAQDLGAAPLDGVVLDIGVSSMQLDEADRGFSFRRDGPLDMRMANDGPSAADLVADLDEVELAHVIWTLGEERFSRQIARAIVNARAESPITRTTQLADIVSKVVWAKPGEMHPATRTFQALRIAVNEELQELVGALAAAERVLKPGGRLVVVTFHSLEDRIVKNFLSHRSKAPSASRHMPQAEGPAPSFRLVAKGAVEPGSDEVAGNPRARSAKLRAAERTDAPAHPDGDLAGLLPADLSQRRGRRRS
ncbi:methyltransferase [Azorhizobium caulinodans ORS 571]|uniref:Ribosomal RNA small subunit methyltransferase H n=1 Tax=Azorhizobium caulinodans (strain ATCC 43989 / DSM 5975 / JCM 20966 / LMG 6465 / NBRC 14845 / NCIMB 13405 / ORS 571) TaxID=438753 RepID=RSMH_AZOC5|nr:16S rRNA (cytosine(1402)-N(4))-methyltransferase RsmH [Azorhizobium caulinodans]A8HZ68.1 RecName: Full=Ribosomal RNA small subunit methyltransferase H; AltName: Full=16S rRNA m(4)C1402 methyltransferase; AltName: Full=rRNA (cytosine-N(4)-)-methyltransferase RsmH [Azorhizobium caulinodans ORS 571]BAF90544.1 methyltransferase [Azorhizobium caulinodans ORS 571]